MAAKPLTLFARRLSSHPGARPCPVVELCGTSVARRAEGNASRLLGWRVPVVVRDSSTLDLE